MVKNKFVLTEDLVKFEPEPVLYEPSNKIKCVSIHKKDRISLNIDADLKKKLVLYCVNNRVKMTDVIEISINDYLIKESNN